MVPAELSPDSSVSDQSPTLFGGLQLAMPVRSSQTMIINIGLLLLRLHSYYYTRYEHYCCDCQYCQFVLCSWLDFNLASWMDFDLVRSVV